MTCKVNRLAQTLALLASVVEILHVAGRHSEDSNVCGSIENLEAGRTQKGVDGHSKGLRRLRTNPAHKMMGMADFFVRK